LTGIAFTILSYRFLFASAMYSLNIPTQIITPIGTKIVKGLTIAIAGTSYKNPLKSQIKLGIFVNYIPKAKGTKFQVVNLADFMWLVGYLSSNEPVDLTMLSKFTII